MAQDSLRDGFVSICLDTSLNYYAAKCRVIVEGQFVPVVGSGLVADVPILINSVNDINSLFTGGSVLAESLRRVFCICPSNVEVWAIPRADAAGAVKAVYDLTIAGPATSDGQFTLFMIDDIYSVSFPVTNGSSVATIAAAFIANLSANFPYTCTATATGIHMVALNGGTVGNYLNPIYNWAGFRNYSPAGVTVSAIRTTPGSINPAAINYSAAVNECCFDCWVLLTDDIVWQRGMRDWLRSNWDCNKPQCFGNGYTYDTGTLGQVLATGDNSEVFNRLAYPVNDANVPWLLVSEYAAKSCCTACSNPELSIQGPINGLLTCTNRPSSCSQPWTLADRLTLAAAGFVLYGPVSQSPGAYTNAYIYNDITNSLTDSKSRPNVTWQSTTTRRWAKNFATTLAAELSADFNGLAAYTDGTQIRSGVFGTTKNLMLARIIAWLRTQEGVTISTIADVSTQVILTSDFDTAPACRGIPGKYALKLTVQPGIRVANINAQILPQILSNCSR